MIDWILLFKFLLIYLKIFIQDPQEKSKRVNLLSRIRYIRNFSKKNQRTEATFIKTYDQTKFRRVADLHQQTEHYQIEIQSGGALHPMLANVELQAEDQALEAVPGPQGVSFDVYSVCI